MRRATPDSIAALAGHLVPVPFSSVSSSSYASTANAWGGWLAAAQQLLRPLPASDVAVQLPDSLHSVKRAFGACSISSSSSSSSGIPASRRSRVNLLAASSNNGDPFSGVASHSGCRGVASRRFSSAAGQMGNKAAAGGGGDCPSKVPVSIIGAGPTGLTLSILLSQYGIPHAVLERGSALTNHPQAHLINMRTMEVGLGRKFRGISIVRV